MKKEDSNVSLKVLHTIENKFDYFLRKNDLLYESNIKFDITYNPSGRYYRIKILPAGNEIDSQGYFARNFEAGEGRKKLQKFRRKNNIGAIAY